ncbi:MAG: hypothetical protein ABIS14_06850 [Sphingomonas sp.]
MTPRLAWPLCALAGLTAMAASMAFGWIPGLAPCGPSGGLGSIMALELARGPGEVGALFGNGACRTMLVCAQLNALLLDGLVFIPSYAAFLALGALALRRAAPVACQIAIAVVLVAALLDEIEEALLYAILRALPGSETVIDLLYWEARTKFALLVLTGLLIAWGFISSRRLGLLAAVPMIGGSLFSAALIVANMHAPMLMQGFVWSWTALLVAAIIGAFWPGAFSPPPGVRHRLRNRSGA